MYDLQVTFKVFIQFTLWYMKEVYLRIGHCNKDFTAPFWLTWAIKFVYYLLLAFLRL